ncbi:glycosyltransferase 87 family protein [Streptomyces sp. NPDC007083]|uniref:glycosyltransferase 87 family protein n=1 Tax=unclassified Streptomyces TaxID=2593676 RepID=UPI0033C994F7
MQALYQLSYSPRSLVRRGFPSAASPAYTGYTAFCQIASRDTGRWATPPCRAPAPAVGTVGPVSISRRPAGSTAPPALRACHALRDRLLRRPTAPALTVSLLSFAAFWAAQHATDPSMIDLMVYRAEGQAVLDGHDLYAMRATYADLPATYPPFAALLFLPLTLPEVPVLRAAATVANLGLLVALAHLSLRLLNRPLHVPRPAAALGVAAVAVWCEPVWTTLRYGQINLLVATLVLWDLTRRPGQRWAGVGIGVAAGIKLTPALFAVFLALHGLALYGPARRRLRPRHPDRRDGQGGPGRRAGPWNPRLRQAAVAAATFLGTALLPALLLPHDSLRFWGGAVLRSDRVGRAELTDNQSLNGVAARLLHTGDPGGLWLGLALLAAALGLGAAVAAALAGRCGLPHAAAWSAAACAVTMLLISPISWSHHWVWCLPLTLLPAVEAQRRRSLRWAAGALSAALVFCSYVPWWVPRDPNAPRPPELRQNGAEILLSACYPLAGVVFLAVTAAVALRTLRGPGARTPAGRRDRGGRDEREGRDRGIGAAAGAQAVAKE